MAERPYSAALASRQWPRPPGRIAWITRTAASRSPSPGHGPVRRTAPDSNAAGVSGPSNRAPASWRRAGHPTRHSRNRKLPETFSRSFVRDSGDKRLPDSTRKCNPSVVRNRRQAALAWKPSFSECSSVRPFFLRVVFGKVMPERIKGPFLRLLDSQNCFLKRALSKGIFMMSSEKERLNTCAKETPWLFGSLTVWRVP